MFNRNESRLMGWQHPSPIPQLHAQTLEIFILTQFSTHAYSAMHLKYRYYCNLAKNACKLVRMYNLISKQNQSNLKKVKAQQCKFLHSGF